MRPSAGRRGASTTTHPALPRNVRGAVSDTALEALSQRSEAPLVLERDAVPVRSYRSRVLGVGVALFAVSVGLVIVVVRPEGASPGSAMDGANEPPVRAHAAAVLEGTEERQAVATRRAAPNSSTCGAQSPPDADAVQTDTRPNRPLRARGATDAVQAAVGAGDASATRAVGSGDSELGPGARPVPELHGARPQSSAPIVTDTEGPVTPATETNHPRSGYKRMVKGMPF